MTESDHDGDRFNVRTEENTAETREPTAGRDINDSRSPRPEGHVSEAQANPSSARPQGYGDGGASPYGQMASGSSDSGLGGYSGGDVGGYGQPNLNSQWGQGGYAPLNQGLDYGQGGSRFGPAGYGGGGFGASPTRTADRSDSRSSNDQHLPSYHHWRDTQLASHDRDYARWRDEQTRRYDEDYGSWRNERHSAFSKEFEGWRAGRGGQAGASTFDRPAPQGAPAPGGTVPHPAGSVGRDGGESTSGSAHGANPTLARIADGGSVHHHKHDED